MTAAHAWVRLELQSRPENVALVRTGLASLDDVLDLGGALLTDVKTAVSEACNNVVLHAYPDAPGPMFVSIECSVDAIEVGVRDLGNGIHQLAAGENRMGLGLGVMSALADRVEFRTPQEGGTDVRMCFRRSEEAPYDFFRDGEAEPDQPPLELAGDAVIWCQPIALVGPVLGRIFRAVAAASHFTLERFTDLYAVTGALAAYAEYASASDTIGIAITGSPRRLELIGGPFTVSESPDGSSTRAAEELISRRESLADLVDGLTITGPDANATVRFVLVDETAR